MEPSQDITGTVIKDTYQIDAFLGEGGPSVVYKGTDLLLDVPVAIKRLKNLASLGDGSSMAERFLREGRTQARLVHQNIIGIRAVLEENNEYYIVMEYVAGCDLSRLLAELPTQQLTWDSVANIFLQVIQGLGYAHEHQVIHRDIKPSNIMVTPEYRVKIADFGIARAVTDSRITQTGYLVGTVAYMCPEQLKGLKVDHRADIYSLGIALYEAITGEHPFRIHEEGVSNFEVMSRHIYEEVRPVSALRPDAPPLFDQVMARALAKEPDERFPSCEAFARALEGALQGGGIDARSPSLDVMRQELEGPFAHIMRRGTSQPPTNGLTPPPASAVDAADGTGVFDRGANNPLPPPKDISEERPSGVLVSVTPSQPSPAMGRSTAEAPVTPADRLMNQAAERATVHDLDTSQMGLEAAVPDHQAQPDTGSFFRDPPEESTPPDQGADAPATGAFDREALSRKIQDQKAAATPRSLDALADAAATIPNVADHIDTAALDAAAATSGIHANNVDVGTAPTPTLNIEASEGKRGGKSFFLVLLGAGLLFGGALVGYFREELFSTRVSPPPGHLAKKSGGLSPRPTPTRPGGQPGQSPVMPPGTSPQTRQPQVIPQPGVASTTCPSSHGDMVFIAAASFLQGEARAKKRSDRKQRQVELSGYCLDRYEVTAQQYQRCVVAKRCSPLRKKQKSKMPVRWVTWGQAFTYCRWAGYKRLPTEAEWEYAASSRSQKKYPWGNKHPTCQEAIHKRCRGPKPVMSKERGNAAGIHDLIGNVWEWVHDCYNAKAYQTLPGKDPKQEPRGRSLRCKRRVIRGGSFRSPRRSVQLRPFFRSRLNTTRTRSDVGFRCAASPLAQRKPRREL